MKAHAILLASFCCLLHEASGGTTRPNIIVILTDDQGYGDVGIHKGPGIRTPHIDQLAAEGLLFTNMRSNATVCSPSRAALLTGRYPDQVGVPGVIRTDPENSWGYLSPAVPTLAEILKRSGYRTALVGKWHLGLESPNTPNERGFDLFHGFLGDMMDSYTTHLRDGVNFMRHNQEVICPAGHATDLFSDWAIEYLREREASKDGPFFLYLAYNAPHFPIEPPAEWLRRVKDRAPDMDPKRAMNAAFIEHLDDGIGRVLAALKETGLEDNTLVVFSSDNGGDLGHAQNNDPWRGGKQSHYDGGLRVPFIMRWPSHFAPGTRSEHRGLLFDVFATALDAAGVEKPPDSDARSLIPDSVDQASYDSRDLYFVRREGGNPYFGGTYEALIRGDWKLLRNTPFEPYELYNLRLDPREERNVAGENPALVKDLSAAVSAHVRRGGSTPWSIPQADAP